MQQIIMPKLGLTMERGVVLHWCKKEGDAVEKGDILFEVETDKSVNEVQTIASGVLGKILVQEGEEADVLQAIAFILEPDEAAPDTWPVLGEAGAEGTDDAGSAPSVTAATASPAGKRPAPDHDTDSYEMAGARLGDSSAKKDAVAWEAGGRRRKGEGPSRVVASPRAKTLAGEHGVDLALVNASSQDGRVSEKDVRAYLASRTTEVPGRLQQITAERMVQSFTTAPHFYLRIEAGASRLVLGREQLLAGIKDAAGIRLTYTDMLVALVAQVLRRHPRLNASWEGGHIQLFPQINIGLATAVADGLVVPVLKDADKKTLIQIARERKGLVEKAVAGRLAYADIEGGTFTLTNLGMYGIDEFDAIINPPQSAILSVGCIKERGIVRDGRIDVEPTVRLVLSIDHRVLDGATGARFLSDLKSLLESPEYLAEQLQRPAE